MDAKLALIPRPLPCIVSIHTPVMDAKNRLYDLVPTLRFNPHARDGREAIASPLRLTNQCFNPHARDGREYSD